ncbi:MAG: hypothetical protein H6597_04515 [Flavobacteriales bacterium]|nr:hypothetical protein [Flavobacteriales bacterium]
MEHIANLRTTMRLIGLLPLLIATLPISAQEHVSDKYDAEGRLQATWHSDGEWVWYTAYYADGRIKERGGYCNGRPQGRWQHYDAEGHLTVQGRFVRGKQDGRWSFRNADGSKAIALRYRDGLLLTGERFDAEGELVERRDLR